MLTACEAFRVAILGGGIIIRIWLARRQTWRTKVTAQIPGSVAQEPKQRDEREGGAAKVSLLLGAVDKSSGHSAQLTMAEEAASWCHCWAER